MSESESERERGEGERKAVTNTPPLVSDPALPNMSRPGITTDSSRLQSVDPVPREGR